MNSKFAYILADIRHKLHEIQDIVTPEAYNKIKEATEQKLMETGLFRYAAGASYNTRDFYELIDSFADHSSPLAHIIENALPTLDEHLLTLRGSDSQKDPAEMKAAYEDYISANTISSLLSSDYNSVDAEFTALKRAIFYLKQTTALDPQTVEQANMFLKLNPEAVTQDTLDAMKEKLVPFGEQYQQQAELNINTYTAEVSTQITKNLQDKQKEYTQKADDMIVDLFKLTQAPYDERVRTIKSKKDLQQALQYFKNNKKQLFDYSKIMPIAEKYTTSVYAKLWDELERVKEVLKNDTIMNQQKLDSWYEVYKLLTGSNFFDEKEFPQIKENDNNQDQLQQEKKELQSLNLKQNLDSINPGHKTSYALAANLLGDMSNNEFDASGKFDKEKAAFSITQLYKTKQKGISELSVEEVNTIIIAYEQKITASNQALEFLQKKYTSIDTIKNAKDAKELHNLLTTYNKKLINFDSMMNLSVLDNTTFEGTAPEAGMDGSTLFDSELPADVAMEPSPTELDAEPTEDALLADDLDLSEDTNKQASAEPQPQEYVDSLVDSISDQVQVEYNNAFALDTTAMGSFISGVDELKLLLLNLDDTVAQQAATIKTYLTSMNQPLDDLSNIQYALEVLRDRINMSVSSTTLNDTDVVSIDTSKFNEQDRAVIEATLSKYNTGQYPKIKEYVAGLETRIEANYTRLTESQIDPKITAPLKDLLAKVREYNSTLNASTLLNNLLQQGTTAADSIIELVKQVQSAYTQVNVQLPPQMQSEKISDKGMNAITNIYNALKNTFTAALDSTRPLRNNRYIMQQLNLANKVKDSENTNVVQQKVNELLAYITSSSADNADRSIIFSQVRDLINNKFILNLAKADQELAQQMKTLQDTYVQSNPAAATDAIESAVYNIGADLENAKTMTKQLLEVVSGKTDNPLFNEMSFAQKKVSDNISVDDSSSEDNTLGAMKRYMAQSAMAHAMGRIPPKSLDKTQRNKDILKLMSTVEDVYKSVLTGSAKEKPEKFQAKLNNLESAFDINIDKQDLYRISQDMREGDTNNQTNAKKTNNVSDYLFHFVTKVMPEENYQQTSSYLKEHKYPIYGINAFEDEFQPGTPRKQTTIDTISYESKGGSGLTKSVANTLYGINQSLNVMLKDLNKYTG